MSEFVTVATFLEPNIAHIARARLESHGIHAVLDGEHHVAMDWFISNAVGGVKLLVDERDKEAAERVLEVSDVVDVDADGDACPKCGSQDTYRVRLNRKLIFVSILLLGIPLPFLSRELACEKCDHRWKPEQPS